MCVYIYIFIYQTCIYWHKHVTNTMEWSPWEANRFSASQTPFVLWNPKAHYQTHKSPPVPFLSRINPVHTVLSHFLKTHFNIILSSMPGSSKWSLSLRFPHQSHKYTSLLPRTCYMHRPSHSSRFYHQNNIWWAVQIIQLLIM